jgi:hypothetical protein
LTGNAGPYSGVFIIPASTPGFLIVDFITEHLEEAATRMREEVSLQQVNST